MLEGSWKPQEDVMYFWERTQQTVPFECRNILQTSHGEETERIYGMGSIVYYLNNIFYSST